MFVRLDSVFRFVRGKGGGGACSLDPGPPPPRPSAQIDCAPAPPLSLWKELINIMTKRNHPFGPPAHQNHSWAKKKREQ